MSSELNFFEETMDKFVKLTVQGEVDIFTSQKFKDKLYSVIDKSNKDVVVDCSSLNYLDSTGLGIFVGALKKAKNNGRTITLVKTKDNIRKLFTITGLDKIFVIE